MKTPRVSLEHWRVLEAVIEQGGFAQAATKLHRSQSSISYSISKLQSQLGLPLLVQSGRKAVLTDEGQYLLQRAQRLLKDAAELETLAETLEQGWEAEVHLVVDAAFPNNLLVEALKRFAPRDRGTRVQLREVILSGAEEALSEGLADLAIAAEAPSDRLAHELMEIEFVAVAHPEHPLHQLKRDLTSDDLVREIQIVVRDSGRLHPRDAGWLLSDHRWTVSSIETALSFTSHGLGFCWLPTHSVHSTLNQGKLKELPLREGGRYHNALFLIFGKVDNIGPATQQLADMITQVVQENAGTRTS